MQNRVMSCGLLLAAVILVGVATDACEVATAPPGASSLAPPPAFAEWWAEVEQCSGRTGAFERVAWYVAPCTMGQDGFPCDVTPNGLCAGEWRAPHTIVLGGPNRFFPDGYVDDEWTVKHEMLHDLLGTPEHPVEFENCHLALR